MNCDKFVPTCFFLFANQLKLVTRIILSHDLLRINIFEVNKWSTLNYLISNKISLPISLTDNHQESVEIQFLKSAQMGK